MSDKVIIAYIRAMRAVDWNDPQTWDVAEPALRDIDPQVTDASLPVAERRERMALAAAKLRWARTEAHQR